MKVGGSKRRVVVAYNVGMSASTQGQLLLASPELLDPNFARAVVLMVEHSELGAMGLVLNRPSQTTLAAAWATVSDEPCSRSEPVFHGGPCEGPMMLLHANPSASQVQVVDGVHFTSDREDVERLVLCEDEPLKACVGYAGWSAGQLEQELQQGAWVVLPAEPEQIFHTSERTWTTLMQQKLRAEALRDIDPRLIPPDPSLN